MDLKTVDISRIAINVVVSIRCALFHRLKRVDRSDDEDACCLNVSVKSLPSAF